MRLFGVVNDGKIAQICFHIFQFMFYFQDHFERTHRSANKMGMIIQRSDEEILQGCHLYQRVINSVDFLHSL